MAKHPNAQKKRVTFNFVVSEAREYMDALFRLAKLLLYVAWWVISRLAALIGIILLIIVLGQIAFATAPGDHAYRPIVKENACEANSALLNAYNDEIKANNTLKDGPKPNPLTCALQRHAIPYPKSEGSKPDLNYYLAFIEFDEEGRPLQAISAETPKLQLSPLSQMDSLKQHLLNHRKNYVVVFVHGWRHNASIGDSNVANTRLFAAYAKSFLEQRCKLDSSYCGVTVTAVYVGWRGARVDENKVASVFHYILGQDAAENFAAVLAFPTLYDRKPVSEAIAPAVISDLRLIDFAIHNKPEKDKNGDIIYIKKSSDDFNRMIVFGHSLGGNLLASALKDTMIAIIRRHKPAEFKNDKLIKDAEILHAPFGDLIVLLNPASEANKWTEIQRAMRERVPFRENEGHVTESDIIAGHSFFSKKQPPIYIAFTAANTWPVGELRKTDLSSVDSNQLDRMNKLKCYAERRVGYDWATDEVFSVFKWDFRPAADTLHKLATTEEDSKKDDLKCSDAPQPPNWFWSKVYLWTANTIRLFPFMQTNAEYSRAIGHLNPLRPPFGHLLGDSFLPSTDFGTTHELTVNQQLKEEIEDNKEKAGSYESNQYSYASHQTYSECDRVNDWLYNARERNKPSGTRWDSGFNHGSEGDDNNLTPVRKSAAPADLYYVESQFSHGYANSGMAPIVRANDPFWNVRAFDTAIHDHGGYMSYPFMCAIHQLVLDNVAKIPKNPE